MNMIEYEHVWKRPQTNRNFNEWFTGQWTEIFCRQLYNIGCRKNMLNSKIRFSKCPKLMELTFQSTVEMGIKVHASIRHDTIEEFNMNSEAEYSA